MFLNLAAIETLVNADTKASPEEKERVIAALRGERPWPPQERPVEKAVVGFKDAAAMLGYKGPRGVYRALRDGVLKGYYGGRKRRRCTGITMESIQRALLGKPE